MATPTLTIPPYSGDFTKTISDLSAEVTTLTAKGDPDSLAAAAAKSAQIAFLQAKTPPVVPYNANIPLVCEYRFCPSPNFIASFPGHQRTLVCPTCGNNVNVPRAQRWEEGTP